jgi:signal transduction histidine kinase
VELADDTISNSVAKGDNAPSTGQDPFLLQSERASSNQALDDERERIAIHLHDNVMQSFATCFLSAQLCERLLQAQRYEQLGKEILILEDRLTDAMDGLRELVTTLRTQQK